MPVLVENVYAFLLVGMNLVITYMETKLRKEKYGHLKMVLVTNCKTEHLSKVASYFGDEREKKNLRQCLDKIFDKAG